MYAVVETGGKQYRMAPGGVVAVERVPGDVGEVVELSRVLFVAEGEATFDHVSIKKGGTA